MQNLTKQFRKLHDDAAPSAAFRRALALRLEAEMIVRGGFGIAWFRFAAVPFAVIIVFVATGAGAFAYASPTVVYDHPLYGVKQGIEAMEAHLALTPERRARYNLKMADRRLDEGEEYLMRHELPPILVAKIDEYMEKSLYEASRVSHSQNSRPEIVERLSLQQGRYEQFLEIAQTKQLIPVILTSTSLDGKKQSFEAAFIVMELNKPKPQNIDREVMTWDLGLLQASEIKNDRNKIDFMRVWIDESDLTREVKQSLLEMVDGKETAAMQFETLSR